MDIDTLRSFIAITDTGSFTLAGQRVGRTQSAISQQVKRLEADLGRPLLERSAAGVSLTPHGARLLPHAREILLAHDRAEAAFDISETGGEVVLGLPEIYAEAFLPRILPRFLAQHPSATFSLVMKDSASLGRLLRDGALDLAFQTETEVGYAGATAEGTPLHTEQPVWASAANANPEAESPLSIVTWAEGTLYREVVNTLLDRSGVPYRIAVSTQSIGGLRAAVAAGLGIAAMLRSNLDPRLRRVPESAGLPRLPHLTVRLAGGPGRLSPIARRLHRHILETFGVAADGQ